MKRIIPFVHQQLKAHLNPDSIAIDATMGNGFDTLFLAKHCKEVYAFDIQKAALNKTKDLLKKERLNNVNLIHDSHEFMALYTVSNIDVVVFNLGYLPNQDKTITTKKTSTLDAIQQSIMLLNKGGLIAVTFYPGHAEGACEVEYIIPYLESLCSKHYEVLRYEFINKTKSPFTVFIKKLRSD